MGILAFAYRIHPSALADEAAHRGIFVPDVAQFHLSNLSQRIMGKPILVIAEQGQFPYKFLTDSSGQDVQR
ncbi:hypothetical protein CLDAP_26390 [Caldilinea aerophila DSM 14535 = NBRC 104270]|uniref:Uncharacterized protein n=1 Tax=Caldilinea aerophila (strain DSM 14535 / JCM 11387 / NBRC 104270 / STL-6-O1) TaxID=926550 RepID=I0I5Z1_CALAS|nr:hypothetical protein CLDAP_26390 [Caldilinea aerophila DSM 14535 = NBRC 104270]